MCYSPLVLASIVWIVGQPTFSDLATTQVGNVVQATLKVARRKYRAQPRSGSGRTSPATRVISVDGTKVNDFDEIMTNILSWAIGRTQDGRRLCRP